MSKPLEDLRKIHDIQSQNGNWDYDPYMHGLMNGLEMALATMEDRDPKYWKAPNEWLSDKTYKDKEEAFKRIVEGVTEVYQASKEQFMETCPCKDCGMWRLRRGARAQVAE